MKHVLTLCSFALLFLTHGIATAHAGELKKASPAQVLGHYMKTLEDNNTDPNLAIYTKDTREWKKSWSVTTSQMDNELRFLSKCSSYETKTMRSYAVIRFAPERNRGCPPYFLKKEGGAWRLDFLSMMKVIRFGSGNTWHFIPNVKHPYRFAFTDWLIDKNGFPHSGRR